MNKLFKCKLMSKWKPFNLSALVKQLAKCFLSDLQKIILCQAESEGSNKYKSYKAW